LIWDCWDSQARTLVGGSSEDAFDDMAVHIRESPGFSESSLALVVKWLRESDKKGTNGGWLAFTDWGSATAPIYAAHRAGIPLHVWVDDSFAQQRMTRCEASLQRAPKAA
jgi:hypothetical protein